MPYKEIDPNMKNSLYHNFLDNGLYICEIVFWVKNLLIVKKPLVPYSFAIPFLFRSSVGMAIYDFFLISNRSHLLALIISSSAMYYVVL